MDKILNISYFWGFFKAAFIIIGAVLLFILILFIIARVLSNQYYKDVQ
jgi:LPS O-antigen subunit length determinant protein (WzzB/FepE family)